MGLTGFNRQRRTQLVAKVGKKNAEKLIAKGFDSVEKLSRIDEVADILGLSKEDRKEVKALAKKKGKATKKQAEADSEPKGAENDNSDEISYAEGIDPEKAQEAFSELEDAEFPEHWYSGHYFLSDGSVVKGKAEATKKQAELEG